MEAILIVDDDESICAMLKETLAKPGRLVQSTNSDEEALALAEHSHFDVVLSDLNLGSGGTRTLKVARARAGRQVELTPGAMAVLSAHSWPGNVRELENTIERLVLTTRSARVREEEVAEHLHQAGPVVAGAFADLPSLDELERRYLIHVLDAARGNRTRAADILKIDRRTLYRMAARFGIALAAEGEETPKGGS